MLKLYGLTQCSTCEKALEWLKAQNIPHQFTDVKESPLDRQQVAEWFARLGGWERAINRAGYTWRGLPDAEKAGLDDARAVALALRNPSLIRRPLIEHDDGSVTVGFAAKVQAQIEGR